VCFRGIYGALAWCPALVPVARVVLYPVLKGRLIEICSEAVEVTFLVVENFELMCFEFRLENPIVLNLRPLPGLFR
jgi:hypothetical protein